MLIIFIYNKFFFFVAFRILFCLYQFKYPWIVMCLGSGSLLSFPTKSLLKFYGFLYYLLSNLWNVGHCSLQIIFSSVSFSFWDSYDMCVVLFDDAAQSLSLCSFSLFFFLSVLHFDTNCPVFMYMVLLLTAQICLWTPLVISLFIVHFSSNFFLVLVYIFSLLIIPLCVCVECAG